MNKINFKQPKYVFPAIIFVPVVCLGYCISQFFDDDDQSQQVATDQINANLPNPGESSNGDKLFEMSRRFSEEDAYTAVGALGQEDQSLENLEHGYSEAELDQLDATAAEKIRQQREMAELERQLAESRKHINSYSGGSSYNSYNPHDYEPAEDYYSELTAIQTQAAERQRMLNRQLGIGSTDDEERIERQRQDSIQRAKAIEREKNRPNLVLKSQDTNAGRFNSVSGGSAQYDAPLIKAMIDRTTKAHEGTRIRFKLLDGVTIKNIQLPKGTYLYGVVTGFGQQRVKANITSILVGNKFINVDLSVFDNDGMEGFYVPESAFRDFMKEAGASAVQQNLNFDSNSGYGGISGEAIALQALQNVYNSATSAISANIRKNRAKIKYNTVVYLVNSKEAK